jgi:peptidoglycan/xylan/chitin deacetylase (PgdA/CDA1 family)
LLREDDLPDRSVVITFDDGWYDFYECAYPILQEFEYPATVYLTTYYCRYNKPIFNVVCSYLLWKGRGTIADGKGIVGREGLLDLRTPSGRDATFSAIQRFVESNGLCAEEKNQIAAALAERLRVDYDAILAKRTLHIMSPEEVGQLAAEGVDIQLHTHRHRTPTDRAAFLREIADNRDQILAMTRSASMPSHFCYPSGVHRPEFLPWLQEAGVISATMCEPGLVSRRSNPLLLPRLLDTAQLAPIEFEGWLAGVPAFLPRWPADRRQ